MRKPLLLDLFCGAGGCARGYMDAGFEVVGVDNQAQPHYCGDEFYQEDALVVLDTLLAGECWHGYRLHDFAVIHASPPCQSYSRSRNLPNVRPRPRLIDDLRYRLSLSGKFWVMENVQGAPMEHYILLCGTMFGLHVYRHRQFESNALLFAPGSPCNHPHYLYADFYCVYGNAVRGRQKGNRGNKYQRYSVEDGRSAMGIDWPMTQKELSQAIPPDYARWIGLQLMEFVLAAQEKIS